MKGEIFFFISCPVTNVRAGSVGGLNSNYVALQMTMGLLSGTIFQYPVMSSGINKVIWIP